MKQSLIKIVAFDRQLLLKLRLFSLTITESKVTYVATTFTFISVNSIKGNISNVTVLIS